MAPTTAIERERAERAERVKRFLKESPEERKARLEERRAKLLETRKESVAGRDLAAEVLSHPDPSKSPDIMTFRQVLFNRPVSLLYEMPLVKRITNNAFSHWYHVVLGAAYPEVPGDCRNRMPALSDAWKMVICDMRYIDEGASIHEAYETQLREEELQTPEERARERIRREDEKLARRNAKWVIPVLESLTAEELARMEEDEGGATLAIWKQVSPAPPAWVQHIADTQQRWGFVFYKSSHVQKMFGRRWDDVWEKIRQRTYSIALPEGERDLRFAKLESIHCKGHMSTLQRLWTEQWATVPNLSILADEDALRR